MEANVDECLLSHALSESRLGASLHECWIYKPFFRGSWRDVLEVVEVCRLIIGDGGERRSVNGSRPALTVDLAGAEAFLRKEG